MILLDLFSGIGGFHLGLIMAGFHFDKVYFSEVDKHAIANYKYNFKNAEHIGSVTNILNTGIERPNIITFGSPCQDFSLAGKRDGLAGNKSSLIEYALSAISHFRPDIFIWENVKGTFSSNNSQDFWSIIQAFANIGGYEIEWQLVNTSWLLPQNRERIYLVGHLATSFRNWKPIFPIAKNDKSNKDIQGQSAITNTIRARQNADGGGSSFIIESKYPQEKNTRRLTEIECERLQGFPDNWTKYGDFEGITKEIPKTQRYKMCGNAVTSKIVELIGKRIYNNILQMKSKEI